MLQRIQPERAGSEMRAGSTREHCSGPKPGYKVLCLLLILLVISSPLHAIACPLSECSTAKSESKTQCHMTEMPQSRSSCAAPVASCCHEGQTPAQTGQRDIRSEATDIILAEKAPESAALMAQAFQTAVLAQAGGSPPDRQSLFCTLLI